MDLKKGVPKLFAYYEKLILKFFFKFNQGSCPLLVFIWIFFSDFFLKGGGEGLWGKSFIGNILCFGAKIFPVVWPTS